MKHFVGLLAAVATYWFLNGNFTIGSLPPNDRTKLVAALLVLAVVERAQAIDSVSDRVLELKMRRDH